MYTTADPAYDQHMNKTPQDRLNETMETVVSDLLEPLREVVAESIEVDSRLTTLIAHFESVLQQVHQAHHTVEPGGWRDCPRSICKDSRVALATARNQ